MKLKNIASIAALLLATLTAAQAQTNTLVGWSFDNLALGANSSPAAAINTGTVSAVGLSTATVVAQPGSSTGSVVGTNAWEVGGGWNTNNAIGSQGVKFTANSVGYYQVQVSFDIYAATNAEALLQVQYSPNGNAWFNANIVSAGSLGRLATNTITTNSIVIGTYLILTNNGGTAAWNNGVTVNLSGVSWADNNPNFAIRIVNAAKGTNCVDTTGARYASNAGIGDWTFDNVVIQGVPFDAAAVWTFEGLGILSINNPPPAISNTTATATCFGFNVTNTLMGSHSSGKDAATNAADILANGAPYSSTGSAGQNVWRLRGAPGNGWLSVLPIGSQGAEFDVDTTGYTNMLLSFDIEFTAQSEAKMCVEYTTDSWATTNVANSLAYALDPAYIMTNTVAFTSPGLNLAGNATYSANTVNGTLLFNTFGAIFFNNVVVDLTGVPNVANNPHFAFRIVNAATGADCVNGIYGPYNNTSGNCRVDNIAVNGKYTGSIAPTVTAQSSPAATVDHPFTNTFPFNPDWSSKIYNIIVNGLTLPPASYAVTSSNIIYTPSLGGSALTLAGTDYITIYATNYTSAKVTQVVGPGAFVGLNIVQPAGPSASGGTLTVNPSFTCVDQFTNPTALTYPGMQVVATVSNSPATWVLGGSVTQAIFNGVCTFSNLTATLIGSTAISNAAITFTVASGPITATNSTSFIIGKPPVPFTPGNLAIIQSDISGANSTLSLIEVKPSVAGQTSPVNIVPITATGTNALRIANAGSGGHLALSDDGTKLVFPGYTDDNSATPDETFNQNRGVGTLDYTNAYVLQGRYVSSSYGGSQARAACSPDNSHYLIDDKGGLYIAPSGTYYNLYNQNNISTKSFGGVCWVATAKTTPASPTASVFIFSDNINANGVGLDYVSDPNSPGAPNPDSVFNVGHTTPAADSFTQDFYMVSTNGNDYSILYVLDASVTSGVGAITKYKMSGTIDTDFTWVQQGSALSLADNGVHLFATTNGSGGVYLFFVNGKNQVIRLTDQAAGGPLTIVASNKIYTATSGNIQGLAFVPQATAYATELMPPPLLTAQATAFLSATTFTITNNTLYDATNWLANVTGISVNGTVLTTGFKTSTIGQIVFTNATPGFVQGPNTIVFAATGYSTNTITQILVGPATQLVMKTEPSTPWIAGATNSTPPALFIEDSSGDVVTTNNSTVVTATVGTGAGPLTGTLTATAVNGVVTFTSLKAPTLAQTGLLLTFTNAALASAVDTTSITVTNGSASKLAFGVQPATTMAGVAISPSVTVIVQDANGNTVLGDSSSVTISSGNTAFTGSTLSANAVAGVATFGNIKPTTAGASKTLAAGDGALTGATSGTFTVNPAAPIALAMNSEPAPNTVAAGAAFATPPTVKIVDAYGNTVTSANSNVVAQVAVGGQGSLSGTTTVAASGGVATFTSALHVSTIPQSGLKLTFTNPALTGVTNANAITVTVGAATQMLVTTQPTNTVGAGAAFGIPAVVSIVDQYSNVVTTVVATNIVALIGMGSGALSGTITNATVSGVATFSGLLAPTVAQNNLTLVFTNSGFANVTNNASIAVTPGVPTQLAITTQPAAPSANGGALAAQPVVVIQDQYGNLVTTATSNIVAQVGAGTWTIGGITTPAAASGTATFAGLTATSAAAVTGATISFTSGPLVGVTSTGFNIPAPVASVPPSLTGAKMSGGNFTFAFTNLTGLSFSVLATNNLTVPKSSWPVVGTAVENPAGSGNYQYTNTSATNGQQYYIIRQP